jgi:hypothetical protein
MFNLIKEIIEMKRRATFLQPLRGRDEELGKIRKRMLKVMLMASIMLLAAVSISAGQSDDANASNSSLAPDRIICGHADADYYYLASYSDNDPGTVYVYDKATLDLKKIISLPFPRYMTSSEELFICTYNEQGGPGGPTEVWSGIAIYNKTDDFSLLKMINLHRHIYSDYMTRQPLIDDMNIYVTRSENANNPTISIFNAKYPFDFVGSIEPPYGDANSGADDDNYVAITTAFYGIHQYVYNKTSRELVADLIGPNHGEGIEFFNHKYLFICYQDCYRKYNYSNLTGPYKEVNIPEMTRVGDVQSVKGCDNMLFRGVGQDGKEVLQIRDPETDELVASFEPTFDGWIQFLSCFSRPTTVDVKIDIKPGSCPNPINLKSKGVLPVAVLGTEDFNVTDINPQSIRLGRTGIEEGIAPLHWSYDDVGTPFIGDPCECHDLNGDGYIDMMFQFDTQDAASKLKLSEFAGGMIPLELTGMLKEENDKVGIRGQDCVRISKK